MTLPASGAISFSQCNVEMGRTATQALTLNDAGLRTMSGVASGTHSMANLRGQSWELVLTFTGTGWGTQQDWNLRTIANSYGYDGRAKMRFVIDIDLLSTATSTPACRTGSWPTNVDLTIQLTGGVFGRGGAGGAGEGAATRRR